MSKYNHLPKALHFDTIRGLSFQLMNFGRENSVHSAKEPFRVDALKTTPGKWVGAGVQLEDGRQAGCPSTTHPVCLDTGVSACRAFGSQRDCGCIGRAQDTRCRGRAAGLLPPTSRSLRAVSTRLGRHAVTGETRPQETPAL